MSEYFNYTPVITNSTVSPTDSLATSVDQAFTSLESIISNNTSAITNYKSVIGNMFLNSLRKHGVIVEENKLFSVDEHSTDFVLDNVPDLGQITVTYSDGSTQTILTLIPNSNDFTSDYQYKVNGKVIVTNLKEVVGNLSVVYTTNTFTLNNEKVLPNCFKDSTNIFLKTPVEVATDTYEVEYDVNIEDSIDEYVVSQPQQLYIFTNNGLNVDYTLVSTSSITINDNVVQFISDSFTLLPTTKVVVVLNNTSIFQLINDVYAEFINHRHGADGVTQNIEAKDLVNRYKNTPKISYGSGSLPNYEFPQYLNREGYNPNLDSVYENAFLGTLFLSRIITDLDQNTKGLDKNSNAVVFGDPVSGPKLYYDYLNESLTLTSSVGLSGLTIFNDNINPQLILNESKFVSNANGLTIQPQDGRINLVDLSPTELTTLYVSLIEVLSKITANTCEVTDTLKIGNIEYTTDSGNVTVSKVNNLLNTLFTVTAEIKLDNLVLGNGLLNSTSKLKIDETNYITRLSDNIGIVNDKAVVFFGSGKDSGISFKNDQNSLDIFKLYNSSSVGEYGTVADTNAYIETQSNQKIYFISNTDESVTKDGITYKFQDASADVNIASLKNWFKTKLVAGGLELSSSDATDSNGLRIGTTVISSIGTGLDCPAGVTIIESAGQVYLIKPRTSLDCNSLEYQDLSLGTVYVKEDIVVDGNAVFNNSLSTAGIIAAEDINVRNTLKATTANIASELIVNGNTTINKTLAVDGRSTFNNSVTIASNAKISELEVTENTNIVKKLFVGESLYVTGDTVLDGSLIINSGIKTDGLLEGESVKVGSIDCEVLTVSNNAKVLGGLEIGGSQVVKGSVKFDSGLSISGNTVSTGDLTCEDIYTTGGLSVRENSTLGGNLTVNGKVVTLGNEQSYVSLLGKVQFNTDTVTFSGITKFLDTVNVLGTLKHAGQFENSSGISTQSTIQARGNITSEGSIYANGALTASTATFNDSLTVNGNTTLQTTSIANGTVTNLATDNIKVFGSLVMDQSTTLVAGEFRCLSINQQDQTQTSYFSGNVEAAKDLSVVRELNVGAKLNIAESIYMQSGKITGDALTILAENLTVAQIQGTSTVNAPSSLFTSGVNSAINLGTQLTTKKFVELDNISVNGITIFNEPVVADEIFFTKLTYIGELDDGSLDITARRALYS
jgi:hypothetical protein